MLKKDSRGLKKKYESVGPRRRVEVSTLNFRYKKVRNLEGEGLFGAQKVQVALRWALVIL